MPIDMSLATAPPKKRAANPSSGRTSVKSADTPEVLSQNEKRTNGLLGLAQLVQGGLLMFGQFADAGAIGQLFPPVAKELANVADSNDTIAKPIDVMIEVGPYGALIAAVLPLGMQIAANHGLIDAGRLMGQGVVPPAVLDAQMKTQMLQMQAAAVAQQNEAIAQAQKAHSDLQDALKAQNQAQAA